MRQQIGIVGTRPKFLQALLLLAQQLVELLRLHTEFARGAISGIQLPVDFLQSRRIQLYRCT